MASSKSVFPHWTDPSGVKWTHWSKVSTKGVRFVWLPTSTRLFSYDFGEGGGWWTKVAGNLSWEWVKGKGKGKGDHQEPAVQEAQGQDYQELMMKRFSRLQSATITRSRRRPITRSRRRLWLQKWARRAQRVVRIPPSTIQQTTTT